MDANELAGELELQSSQMEYGYAVNDWKLLSDAAELIVKQSEQIKELQKKLNETEIQAEDYFDKFMVKSTEYDALQDSIHWIGLDLVKLSGWVKNYG